MKYECWFVVFEFVNENVKSNGTIWIEDVVWFELKMDGMEYGNWINDWFDRFEDGSWDLG